MFEIFNLIASRVAGFTPTAPAKSLSLRFQRAIASSSSGEGFSSPISSSKISLATISLASCLSGARASTSSSFKFASLLASGSRKCLSARLLSSAQRAFLASLASLCSFHCTNSPRSLSVNFKCSCGASRLRVSKGSSSVGSPNLSSSQ